MLITFNQKSCYSDHRTWPKLSPLVVHLLIQMVVSSKKRRRQLEIFIWSIYLELPKLWNTYKMCLWACWTQISYSYEDPINHFRDTSTEFLIQTNILCPYRSICSFFSVGLKIGAITSGIRYGRKKPVFPRRDNYFLLDLLVNEINII